MIEQNEGEIIVKSIENEFVMINIGRLRMLQICKKWDWIWFNTPEFLMERTVPEG